MSASSGLRAETTTNCQRIIAIACVHEFKNLEQNPDVKGPRYED